LLRKKALIFPHLFVLFISFLKNIVI